MEKHFALALTPDDGYVTWVQRLELWRNDPGAYAGTSETQVRVALLATYTIDFLAELLPMAGARVGLAVDLLKFPFGQIEQVLLNPPHSLEDVDYVVLTGTHHDVADSAEETVRRWTRLWDAASGSGIRVVQLGFAPPAVDGYGAAAWRTSRSRSGLVRQVNEQLVPRPERSLR
ncbi:hypothetical protein [Nocardia sp. NPDC050175]|uniref:hypothetical protein n=1 Tax=Nocardia sp. NPDC050175 TaxID=3364317 RepID=UPI003789CE4B